MRRMRGRIAAALMWAVLGNGGAFLYGAETSFEQELVPYDYRDTRKVLRAVREAADWIEAEGTNAIERFRQNPKHWKNDLFYIYVYATNGLCLYHPAMPDFEGRNLLNITDAEGHKVLQMAFEAGDDPDNPHGWLHYSWHPAGGFSPAYKSSCHFYAEMPEGGKVLVGGGMEAPPEERVFAKYAVDSAVRLLNEKGRAALEDIARPASKYRFREITVFVLDAEGNALVDPALETHAPRNLSSYVDAAGHFPFREIVRKLSSGESCWEVILSKNRYARVMEKKGIYARRAVMDGTPVIVGAATLLPKPIWSK